MPDSEQIAAQVPTDLVSQIQESFTGLCELFFNTAGTLQRDAQLASVAGEPVDNSGRPPKADVPALGKQVVNASKAVDALIAKLPPLDKPEQQQLQEIADLMEQNDRVGLELREQTALLEAKLASVQRIHTAVTDALLDES